MKLNGIRKYINSFFGDLFFKKISAKKKLTKNSLFNTSDFSEWTHVYFLYKSFRRFLLARL